MGSLSVTQSRTWGASASATASANRRKPSTLLGSCQPPDAQNQRGCV